MIDRKPVANALEGDFAFYRDVLAHLQGHRIPFLVGGAYAFHRHTGIERHTRDFDVFLMRDDVRPALERLEEAGYRTTFDFPHWLAKVRLGDAYVDLIFSSGNGIARVDHAWFEHAVEDEVLGTRVRLCPIEEMIWSKAFIMERERFDGADVLHLLRAGAATMDWDRLLGRFGDHARVLLAHVVLFGFVYPDEPDVIPRAVVERLLRSVDVVPPRGGDGARRCLGTLLSRSQYLADLAQGLRDGRLPPDGGMSPRDIAHWTHAAGEALPDPLADEADGDATDGS